MCYRLEREANLPVLSSVQRTRSSRRESSVFKLFNQPSMAGRLVCSMFQMAIRVPPTQIENRFSWVGSGL